jgi:hypothetical protein
MRFAESNYFLLLMVCMPINGEILNENLKYSSPINGCMPESHSWWNLVVLVWH